MVSWRASIRKWRPGGRIKGEGNFAQEQPRPGVVVTAEEDISFWRAKFCREKC
jgi:hypothetical protein